MNKFLRFAALCAVTLFLLPGCSDEKEPQTPVPTITSNGIFVLNAGNQSRQIDGTLNYINYSTQSVDMDLFAKANGRSIGNNPQAIIVKDDYIYIGVYKSNTIEIIDKNTFVSVKQIQLAEQEANSPRSMVEKDGKIYISMYTGYISRFDISSQSIDATVKVGPNPQNIAILDDKLYVPNSDGGNYKQFYTDCSISVIDLKTFTVSQTIPLWHDKDVTVPDTQIEVNPNTFATNGKDLFLLCMGGNSTTWDFTPAACVYKIDPSTMKAKKLMNSSNICVNDNYLYSIYAPNYGNQGIIEYKKYDIASGSISNLVEDDGVEAPWGVYSDPVSGNIFLGSYPIDDGKVSYYLPGYIKEYSSNGVFLRRYEVGGGAGALCFNLQ